MTDSTQRPWWKFTTRRPYRAIESVPMTGADPKLEYCRICKMDVTVEVQQAMNRGLYVYRKNCLRCGKVIAFGVAKTDLNKKGPLDPRVLDFVRQTVSDRR